MDEPFSDPARLVDSTRVDALLAGIVAEVDAATDAADDAEIVELERAGRAGRQLLDRFRDCDAARIEIFGGELVTGWIVAVGRDCVVVAEPAGDWVIPVSGIVAVVGLDGEARRAIASLDRLGMLSVIRSWARDREVVRVFRAGGAPLDGTIDAVGADYVDIAEHDPGEPRRTDAVRRVATVPVSVVTAVRRRA